MPRRYWPTLAAIALLALCLWRIVPAMRADDHLIYPLDDTYIHMGMAKHLALHGTWGMTRYEFSSSSSSPLWTMLLAGVYAATGPRDTTPLVLNVLCAIALLAVTDRALTKWSVPAVARAVVLAALVLAVPLPPLVLMGMEHVLHLLLSVAFAVAVIEPLTAQAAPSTRRIAMLCVLAALLGASRYEGYFLVAIACVLLAIRRRLVAAVIVGLAALVPLAALGLISLANGSPFLPNSLLLKAGGEQLSAWQVLFKPPTSEDLELFRRTPALVAVLLASVLSALAVGVRRRSGRHPAVLACVLLVGMMALHAHFAFSSLFWVYRHDAYLVGFGLIAAALVTTALPAAAGAVVMAALLIILLMVSAAPEEAWSGAQTLAESHANYLEHYRAAEFVAAHYPAGPVVVNDIGALSYRTDARLLDMFGLGSVEPIRIRRANAGAYTAADVERWTGEHHPAAAIVQLGWAWVLPRLPASWIKVADLRIVSSGQTLGFFAMSPDAALALRQRVSAFYRPLSGPGGDYVLRVSGQ